MNIQVVNRLSFEELEERVRSVPLLKACNPDGSKIFVYQQADIRLRKVSTDELNPTTFYVVKKNLEFQRDLRVYLLAEHGVDTLALDGALELENRDTNEQWTLIPPVVEVSEEDVFFDNTRGDLRYDQSVRVKVPIINDGAHRAYLARKICQPLNVLSISNIPPEHPFYAYPNPWHMVNVVDAVPKSMADKKLYRRSNSYDLYRDFGVLGCGAPRKVGQ